MDPIPALFRKDASVLRQGLLRCIGVRLRTQREMLGFTLDEVALGNACATSIISAIEAGEKPPSTNLLFWFARAGADITFVLTGNAIDGVTETPRRRFLSTAQTTDALRAAAG